MKKKMKGVLFATLLAVAGLFGVSSTLIDNEVKETPVVEKAEAATATTVYYAVDTSYTVKCNVNRKGDGDDWATYTMTKVSGTEGIYKATFTDLYNGLGCLQFQLYDGNTWKSQVQPISSWTSVSTYNNKLYYNGGWTNSFKKVVKSTSPSSSTGRVFFHNSGTHWANGGACAVYAWGGSASSKIDNKITIEGTFYHFSWFEDDNGTYYGVADVPTDVTGYKIAKLNNDSYVTSLSYDSDNTFTMDSVGYVRYAPTDGNWISTGGAKDGVAGSVLMQKVIEAYDTCSNSVLNGYGAYDALNDSFYSHATSSAKSTVHASMSGEAKSIQTHFEAMAARKAGGSYYGAIRSFNPFTLMEGESGDNVTTIIIIIASSVSLLSITALSVLLVKKRKNKEQ